MKKFLLSFLLAIKCVFLFAQQTTIQGKVLDYKSQQPLENVVATLHGMAQTALTNAEGTFIFNAVNPGSHKLTISSTGYISQVFTLEVAEGQPLNIGIVFLEEDITTEQQLSLISITDADLGDDNSGSENTAGLLQASRDVFQQAAAFNWGMARFRIRGLDNVYGTTMINGIPMNKIYDGRPQWSNWGGLNDATRNQEFTMGTAPSDYTFGSLLGTQEINTRASLFRPGSRVSFAGTNTSYSWRPMVTHASGLGPKGWAYVVSASARRANEGHFEGTDYSAASFFGSLEKKINRHHSINLTAIYAQNSRGKNSPNTAEVTALMGTNYNSYWGYQDGEKRNSRDKDVEEPIIMLNHFWTISQNTSLATNVAYQFGKIGNSRIDFQDVNNPDPTYYRNLPSFYTSQFQNGAGVPAEAYLPGGLGGLYIGNTGDNPRLAGYARETFLSNPQLNWDSMYLANTIAITDETNTETGRAPSISRYVLYEDRTDDKTLTANAIIRSQLSDNIALNGGATFRKLKSHNFQNLLDLLGGAYYNDIDPFYTGAQAQANLDTPNRQVGVGDTFGYNYNLLATQFDAFSQLKFNYKTADIYAALNYSRSDYQREGLYRNGLYPNNSLGNSEKITFDNFGLKGGATYKIDGRKQLIFNGMYATKAPTLRNTFPNARLNNTLVPGIDSESILSADLSYVVRLPGLKVRLTGFYATIQNATETSFFFAEGIGDGDDPNAFIAETVADIDKNMMGAELGIEYQVTTTLKLIGAAAYGKYIYANNPNVSINNDALAELANIGGLVNPTATRVDFGQAALKDYRLPGMPQQAYSVGIEYRDPHYWWIGGNGNYLGSNYIDVSALLRTEGFLIDRATGTTFTEATPQRAGQLLKQEEFAGFYLFNIQGGKSWKTGKKIYGFFASINNVFNTSYKSGGFEQARNASYRELNQDISSGTPAFAPRYYYGYGRTYFINMYINF